MSKWDLLPWTATFREMSMKNCLQKVVLTVPLRGWGGGLKKNAERVRTPLSLNTNLSPELLEVFDG